MTRHRTTHALLVVVALLLALNLASALPWPTAQAQEPELWPPPVPRIIQISSVGYHTGSRHENKLYRLWSDGVIEANHRFHQWAGWEVVPDMPAP